jgi:hypothetical protein
MTNITGYAIDVIKTSTYISSDGYTYLSGATVTVGAVSNMTSGGYFNVSGVADTATTVVVAYPRYATVEVATTSAAIIAVWKNKFYT